MKAALALVGGITGVGGLAIGIPTYLSTKDHGLHWLHQIFDESTKFNLGNSALAIKLETNSQGNNELNGVESDDDWKDLKVAIETMWKDTASNSQGHLNNILDASQELQKGKCRDGRCSSDSNWIFLNYGKDNGIFNNVLGKVTSDGETSTKGSFCEKKTIVELLEFLSADKKKVWKSWDGFEDAFLKKVGESRNDIDQVISRELYCDQANKWAVSKITAKKNDSGR